MRRFQWPVFAFRTGLIGLLWSVACAGAAAELLDVELGKPYPADPGVTNELRSQLMPADTIRQRNSGGLAGVFSHFEVWVLSEPERRAAFVMANRVFDDRDACEASKAELSAAISARLGTPDFPHAASVEEAPREGTEYVFACHSPIGTDAVLLNFVVRSAEMSREFDRISQQKLKKFNRRAE